MNNLSEKQQELKEKHIKERGFWTDYRESLLKLDEKLFEAYLNYSAIPWKRGVLDPKIKEFIYIAMDISTTHLYQPGTTLHCKNALNYGATKEELMEILELCCPMGIQSYGTGIPILIDELKNKGELINIELNDKQKDLKEQFINERGYWEECWDGILALDEELFISFLELSSVPWKYGVLDPKIKELLCIAINVSVTHLNESAVRTHIRNALNHGATKEEILEVFQLVSAIGAHSLSVGVPLLVKVL